MQVREQREGQDLPRLLAGVMHKTDPVVNMQRQKERGEREKINVLIENMVRKETTKLDAFAEL